MSHRPRSRPGRPGRPGGPAAGRPGTGWAGPRCAARGRGTMLVSMSSDEGSVAPAGHGYGATLWEPDAETVRNARISHYMRWLADRGIQAGNSGAPAGPGSAAPAAVYQRLWEWSVANPAEFWTSIWDYFDVLGDRGDGPALTGTTMPDVHWFPDATLNYARNALRTAWTDPDRPAIIAVSERRGTAELSYAELAAEVARVARGLRALGVTKGDRVVALLPNIPEAVIGLLAAASIGAIWSSCSPDFGARSVVDRFAQIEPAVLLAVDGYTYNGKDYPRTGVVAEIAGQLPTLKAVVMVGLLGTADANPPELPAGVQRLGWAALGDGAQGTGRARVRGGAVRAPAVGRLLQRHDGPAEADRARPRRHRARAPQGARAAHGPEAGRPVHLVHHDRLDDVEFPGRRPAGGHHDRGLRRQRHVPRHGPAVAARRRRAAQLPGRRRAVPDGLPEGGPGAERRLRPLAVEGYRLDRLTAAARGLHLGLRQGQGERPARLPVRRHRRVHRVRRVAALCCRSAPASSRAAASARTCRPSTSTATPSSARSASWC